MQHLLNVLVYKYTHMPKTTVEITVCVTNKREGDRDVDVLARATDAAQAQLIQAALQVN